MIPVSEVFYLLDVDETPLKALDVHEFEKESVFQGLKSIKFKVSVDQEIITEQQIIFRKDRYIIENIEEEKTSELKIIEAVTALNELNDEHISVLSIKNEEFAAAVKKLAERRGWTVTHVDDDEGRQYSVEENDVSALYGIKKLTTLAEFFIEDDTIKRELSFRKTSGRYLDLILRYGKNVTNIKRTIIKPRATELKPIGNGGITIESVNDGKDYVEDYSWYESLGIPIQEARRRFRKRHVYRNERFIYPGNLMRRAQQVLRELAHPQISYEVEVADIGQDVKVGDYGYIVDEDLGIRVQVRVVRLLEYEDETKNKAELNYFVEGLEALQEDSITRETPGDIQMVVTYNETDINVTNVYNPVVELAFTSHAPTNMQIGLTIVGYASTDMLLEGYFDISGNKVGRELKQEVKAGWNTITMNFLILQVEEGADFLRFFLKTNMGMFSIERDKIELYIMAKNLLGGTSASLPRANVVEDVEVFNPNVIQLDEHINFNFQPIVKKQLSENLEVIDIYEVIEIDTRYSILFDVEYTSDPPATPTGVQYTIGINAVSLEWQPNTEEYLAGYNVYVNGIKQNIEVIFTTNYNITGLEAGQTYEIKLTAISIWNRESEPYVLEITIP